MCSLNHLVETYVTDNLSVCDERDITYQLYDELLDLLRQKQINAQKAMTTLLPRINSKVVLPNDIANLTRKVKKHLDAGRSREDVILSLLPKENDTDEISKYCSKAGITVDNLHSDDVLDISSDFLTNQLVYDLETYRQKNNFPLSEKRDFDSGTDIEVTELQTRLEDMENENQELKEKISSNIFPLNKPKVTQYHHWILSPLTNLTTTFFSLAKSGRGTLNRF